MEAVVEEVIAEKPEQPVENSEPVAENPPEATGPKKNGRPAGSKDKVKRVVKPRKITILEEAISMPSSASASVPVPKAPRAVPTPTIEYRDRFVEHSPRSLIQLAHEHIMEAEHARRNARREHFSNMIMSKLR